MVRLSLVALAEIPFSSAILVEVVLVNSWVVVYYRPIFLISFLKEVFSEKCYSFPVGFLFHEEGSPLPPKIF
jgi:hypothetical protein